MTDKPELPSHGFTVMPSWDTRHRELGPGHDRGGETTMRLFGSGERRRQTQGMLFAVAFVMSLLLTVFFHVQVMAGEGYAAQSDANRLHALPIAAPRGTVLDRDGAVVATNVSAYS